MVKSKAGTKKPIVDYNSKPTQQDINILFKIIDSMPAYDALKAVDKITDNTMLLSRLATCAKYAKVQIKAKKKLGVVFTPQL